MGPEAKVLPLSCMDLFLTLLKCRYMLMAIFNSTLESLPYYSNNMGQAR